MASEKKKFFEEEIKKNTPPPKPKKERVWTPVGKRFSLSWRRLFLSLKSFEN
jgi:hypothetical protein